jgi:hypothetical protein
MLSGPLTALPPVMASNSWLGCGPGTALIAGLVAAAPPDASGLLVMKQQV